jgi:hypothetical protein
MLSNTVHSVATASLRAKSATNFNMCSITHQNVQNVILTGRSFFEFCLPLTESDPVREFLCSNLFTQTNFLVGILAVFLVPSRNCHNSKSNCPICR